MYNEYYFIIGDQSNAVISDNDATSSVPVDAVLFYLGEAGAAHNDASSLVLVDSVLRHVWVAVEHDDSIVVIEYGVCFDPAVAALNDEDAFTPRWMYLIVEYDCVLWVVPSTGDVRLEVSADIILLNVSTCPLDQEDALPEIAVYLILVDRYCGALHCLHPCSPVVWDHLVLLYPGIVLLASTEDPVLLITLDFIKLNYPIASQEILGDSYYSILIVLSYLIHYNERVAWQHFNACLALADVATLYLRSIAFVHSDALPFHIVYLRPQYELLSILPLCVNPHQAALGYLAVLYLHIPLVIWHCVDGSWPETHELARTHHHIWVHKHTARCHVVIITHKLTVNYVNTGVRHSHKAGDFSFNVLRKRPERKQTISEDDPSPLNKDYCVHILIDVKLLDSFDISFPLEWDICLYIVDLVSNIDPWVRNQYFLYHNKLIVFQIHSDHRSFVAQQIHRLIFVSGLYLDARLSDLDIACIHSFTELDNCPLFSHVDSFLKRLCISCISIYT
jgi:hypothetical protein